MWVGLEGLVWRGGRCGATRGRRGSTTYCRAEVSFSTLSM